MAVTGLRPPSRQKRARRVGHPKFRCGRRKAGPPAAVPRQDCYCGAKFSPRSCRQPDVPFLVRCVCGEDGSRILVFCGACDTDSKLYQFGEEDLSKYLSIPSKIFRTSF